VQVYNRSNNIYRPITTGEILTDGKSVLDKSENGSGETVSSPSKFLKHKGIPDTYHLRYMDEGERQDQPISAFAERSCGSQMAQEIGMAPQQVANLEQELTDFMAGGDDVPEDCKVQERAQRQAELLGTSSAEAYSTVEQNDLFGADPAVAGIDQANPSLRSAKIAVENGLVLTPLEQTAVDVAAADAKYIPAVGTGRSKRNTALRIARMIVVVASIIAAITAAIMAATRDTSDVDPFKSAYEAWLNSAECAEEAVSAGNGGLDNHVRCEGCEQLATMMRAGKCLWSRNEWSNEWSRNSDMAGGDSVMETTAASADAAPSSATSSGSAAAPEYSSTNNQVSSRL
jgi:hypothetical protein